MTSSRRMYYAGVDSSTQGCKVVILDGEGNTVRMGKANHPAGTEVDPEEWWTALQTAIRQAGGLDDVRAIAVAGQQHGMVVLDKEGNVIRKALLWNDNRSADAARQLIKELGGPEVYAKRIGLVPVASFTATKIRWLRDNEADNASKVAAIILPHDYLTWRLLGYGPNGPRGVDLETLVTDRSDVSGTGYWSGPDNEYDFELFERTFSRSGREAAGSETEGVERAETASVILPRVLKPNESAGLTPDGIIVGPGLGDNAGGALGLNTRPGDVVASIGTSGAVFSPSDCQVVDPSGTVAGFADGTGRMLPLLCTLNGARILTSALNSLNLSSFGELSELAEKAEPKSDGVVLVPFYEGERTPNLPKATASIMGLTLSNAFAHNIARAHFEALVCTLMDGICAVAQHGVEAKQVYLIGGASVNPSVQKCATEIFGIPVLVPEPGEYVARGAAIQAAWVATGKRPTWTPKLQNRLEPGQDVGVYSQYKRAQSRFIREYNLEYAT